MKNQPYKSKGRPTVVSKAMHETKLQLLNDEIEKLKTVIESQKARLTMKDDIIRAQKIGRERSELIIDHIIGFSE